MSTVEFGYLDLSLPLRLGSKPQDSPLVGLYLGGSAEDRTGVLLGTLPRVVAEEVARRWNDHLVRGTAGSWPCREAQEPAAD